MIKLEYPIRNDRWDPNDLVFQSWEEYWKTLGYLSNPEVHRRNNCDGNIKIKYEHNEETNSYSGTSRIHYYGDVDRFSEEFPSLFQIRTSASGNAKFRINRKEFGETLIFDLGFEVIDIGLKDELILPPSQDSILQRMNRVPTFDINSWNEGFRLGNL